MRRRRGDGTRRRAPGAPRLRTGHGGFPRITPHDLRHTAASLAVSAGANVKAVQKMLGHASAAMTVDVYADLFDRDAEAVADAHDERLSGAVFAPNAAKLPPNAAGAAMRAGAISR
jgi:integrase